MMPTGVMPPSCSICYVHCNFCNTMLAVNVPGNNLLKIVTVKCGHCSNLLSVNVGDLLPALPNLQEFKGYNNNTAQDMRMECGSSSRSPPPPPPPPPPPATLLLCTKPRIHQEQATLPITPSPEKKQRVPSAYNRFIKEEIQRIKANNPEISHRQAFSTAAKNWAHLPTINFGLNSEGNKQQPTNNIDEHNNNIISPRDQKKKKKARTFFQ